VARQLARSSDSVRILRLNAQNSAAGHAPVLGITSPDYEELKNGARPLLLPAWPKLACFAWRDLAVLTRATELKFSNYEVKSNLKSVILPF
jgi:hypothetical protein